MAHFGWTLSAQPLLQCARLHHQKTHFCHWRWNRWNAGWQIPALLTLFHHFGACFGAHVLSSADARRDVNLFKLAALTARSSSRAGSVHGAPFAGLWMNTLGQTH